MTTVRFRPMFGRIITIVIMALALVGLAGFVAVGDWLGFTRNFGTIAFIAVMVWAVFWRPELVVSEEGVRVVNVFSTHEIPWQTIESVDTRYSVSIHTARGKVSVWASPSPKRRGGRLQQDDTAGTDPGQIAQLLRQHWESVRDNGEGVAGAANAPRIQERLWHWKTIIASAALLMIGIILPFV